MARTKRVPPAAPSHDGLLTTSEAATYLGINKRSLTEWRYRRCGPAFHVLGGGNQVRYRRDDLDAFVAASRVDPRTRAKCGSKARKRTGKR